MPRTFSWLCLLLALAAGCGTPEGYERVTALVKPDGRAIAIVPFTPGQSGGTLVDGVKLAEFAALELRSALPNLQVFGPSNMQELLKGDLNEARWNAIGREVGAKILVVGEITFLEAYQDKLLQSREGSIGVRFRILDVSAPDVAKPLSPPVDWRFGYPEDVGDKFDPKFVSMDDLTFRHEVLRHGARQVAGVFYDHLKKKAPVRQIEIRWRKE